MYLLGHFITNGVVLGALDEDVMDSLDFWAIGCAGRADVPKT